MKVLVCNAGSTSLKFKLYEMPQDQVIAQCRIERVGGDDAIYAYENCLTGRRTKKEGCAIFDYRSGVRMFIDSLTRGEGALLKDVREIGRVGCKATLSKGHYGVHEMTNEVIQGMRDWLPLARLHNTAWLETIAVMRDLLPDARFVGAFETSFHTTIPMERRLYGLPYEWYEKYGVERLGYHSASHGYIADVLNKEGKPYRAISCHLGGSSSVCAIENGRSIDTSFGMSLQSGVMHANRVGDMDGDLVFFLRSEGLTEEEIIDGMNFKGGMLGISGVSGDLRYIEKAAAEGNGRAELAINMFVSSVVRYIGAFHIDLGGLDDLVFTGGIGEKSSLVRERVCAKLGVLGVKLDGRRNAEIQEGIISAADSAVAVRIIPTDEELGIARRTCSFL